MAIELEKVSFQSNPKERESQGMFTLLYSCSHFTYQQGNAQNPLSWDSKVCEQRTSRWRVQTILEKVERGTRHQIANIHCITEKARESQKNLYFCFLGYAKAFDCVDHNKLWKILKEMGIPNHLTCLLRSLYSGQEATVTTGHGTKDGFQIGKGVYQVCILSPCLFNL